jgi:RNA polymerase sigma-70 factor (ECF subfamily)
LERVEDDLELIRRVGRHDREAFEKLYYRHAPGLGRYAFKLLRRREAVDEVINDVMLAVWQHAGRFDDGVSTVSAWLFGITHNKVSKMLEGTAKRERALAAAEAEPKADGGQEPEGAAIGHELGAAMATALRQLSSDHRAVIELAFGQGQSYQEIASVLGCPVNTVKTRMHYARKLLGQLLKRNDVP